MPWDFGLRDEKLDPQHRLEPSKKEKIPHYYGDEVRKLFILNGAIMLVALPFFRELIDVPIIVAIIAIVILGFAAGITSPVQKTWLFFSNTTIAAIGFVVFEYYAIASDGEFSALYFIFNQLIAIIFFLALYYSTKTLRGALEKENKPPEPPNT